MSATQRAATVTPGLSARDQRDHDHRNRPEWPITFTGIRTDVADFASTDSA
jgi:hypothetical protein